MSYMTPNERDQIRAAKYSLYEIIKIVHDYDQLGPDSENRFAEIEQMVSKVYDALDDISSTAKTQEDSAHLDYAHALALCAWRTKFPRGYIDHDEAFVKVIRDGINRLSRNVKLSSSGDFLSQALNEGDGVYRP